MTSILGSKPLAGEHMAQVGATIVADDLDTTAIGIRHFLYCSWNFIIKRRPAAIGVKFIFRLIQWCVAPATYIGAMFFVIGVLAYKWPFGAFMHDHSFFFVC